MLGVEGVVEAAVPPAGALGLSGSHFTTLVAKSELLTCAQSVRFIYSAAGGIQFLSIFTYG